MLPPTVVVKQRRRPGRPPVDETDSSVYVGVTIPSRQYDDLYKRAKLADVSIPEIIRRDLDKKI